MDKPKVERFEDMIAWRKARSLVGAIYQITDGGSFARDFGLRDQIRRAAVSIMSNIAEGFERASRPDFHRFVVIAKGSCAEVRSQLYIAFDVGHIDNSQLDSLLAQADEVGRVLGALRVSLDSNRSAL